MMEYRSPLGRVRGPGSTWFGVHHFWALRLSAVAMIPLFLWFAFNAVDLVVADLATFKAWVGAHYNPVLLGILVALIYQHGQLGLQVVIEDYIADEGLKITSLIIVKLTALLLGLVTIFAILRLTFGS